MDSCKVSGRRMPLLLVLMLAGSSLLSAADDATLAEIATLKATLAAQQKQLEALQQAIERQQSLLDRAGAAEVKPPASAGNVASLAPIFPVAPLAASALPPMQIAAPAGASANPCETGPESSTPAYLRLGSVCIVPVGFMDLTGVWRDKNAGTGIGTNFGNIPYNNTVQGKLSEFRFSTQNSRIGFRIDGDWKGAHFIGYNEFDFLGASAGNNLGVTNGAFVPRVRLYWVDVRKGRWEFLAGQSWSMLTPNRKGISAVPGDLFYTQVIDVNYTTGLTWTRQGGVRVLYHPGRKLTLGLSLENPDQYIGGSGGAPVVTLPTALASLGGAQFDNNTTAVLTTPNLHPDIIAKVAFDPSPKVHFEVAGIERTFKLFNPNTGQSFTAAGGGGEAGLNVELVKNLRAITTSFWSDGGGRYLFGEAPDVIVRADGAISAVHSGGTVDGLEATVKNVMLYGYYGGAYIGRNSAFDANGTTRVGYGFTGSANSNNRTQQEITFGFNQTLWKDPRYGAINYMMQYQYQFRSPWFVAPGAPKGAHDNAVYLNIRYTLPGNMPNF